MKRLLQLIILILLINSLSAQNNTDYVIGKKTTLYSEILGESRSFNIYLPESYKNSTQKYPLLITLDGYFLSTTGIIEYLAYSGNIPEMILVSINNTDRDRDFTPTNSKNIEGEYIPSSGGAKNFLNFIERELLTYLDSNYRIQPFRIIAGHSLGGLFVTYAMLEKPELFQSYYAASPTLPWDNEWILDYSKMKIQKKYPRNLFFQLITDNQSGIMKTSAQKITHLLKLEAPENFQLMYKQYVNEDHISCFLIGFYDALRYLYSDYKISDTLITTGNSKGIEIHYNKLSEKYGYEIIPSWNWLDWIANWHLLMERYEISLSLYMLALNYYPEFPIAYRRVGYLYEKMIDKASAIEYYSKAAKFYKDDADKNEVLNLIEDLKINFKGN